MLGKRILFGTMLAFLLFSIALSSDAMLGDDQMVQLAESIVIGTVEQTVSHWDADHRNIVTDVTFSVERRLKGQAAPQLQLTFPGGKVGDLEQEVSDSPRFFEGERLVLFLQSGDFPIVGGQQGKLLILDNRLVDRNMPLDEYLARLAPAVNMHSVSTPTPGLVLPLSLFEYEEAVMPTVLKPERKTQDESLLTQNQVTATTTILTEGFDSGFPTGAWVTSSLANGHTWDDETFKPHGGAFSAWCAGKNLNPAVDNYANSMIGWMKWGPFNLSDATSAQMTFYLWLESESGLDYIKWGSSIDGNVFALAKTSGATSGWMQLTLDLASRVGASQVWIAFCFTSSTANAFKGAFIDDVVVSKVVADAGSPQITSISPGKASAGTNTQVTVSGSNFGATQGTGLVEFFYRTGQPKISAPIISWSNTAIVCEVPVGTVNGYSASAGSGPVTVRNNAGQTSLGYNFIVSFGYGLRQWNANNVPYYINQNNPNITGEGAAIQAAADTWTYDGAADFSFTYAGTHTATSISYNAKNEILWTSLGVSGPIGQATCWFSNGVILENDIAFNTDYAWGIGVGAYYDVETICLHEFGHWLNLRDLYGDIGDSVNDRARVMYGFGYMNALKRDLTADDQAGILYVYGPAPVFDDLWATEELNMSETKAQMRAASGTTIGTATVYDEVCPLVTSEKTIGRWWAMHASGGSHVRLYYTAAMLAEAGFNSAPTIYHNNGSAWVAVSTGAPQVEGEMLFVESTEIVTSWSPFTLFDSGPIAVQMTAFQAVAVPQGVELNWTTAQEINIAGYELQRRTDDDAWQIVASYATHSELAAQSENSADYQFTDSRAPRSSKVSYRLRAVQLDGTTESWSETSVTTTAVDNADLPDSFALHAAYPNPFNPTTTIAFDLPCAGAVTVTVYNVIGRQVDVLLQETLKAGRHQQVWNAANFPSGVYFIQVQTEGFRDMQRVLLLK